MYIYVYIYIYTSVLLAISIANESYVGKACMFILQGRPGPSL